MKKVIVNLARRFVKEEWGGVESVVVETSKEFKKLNYNPKIFTSTIFSNQSEDSIYGILVKRFKYSYTRLFLKDKNRALLDKRGGDLYSIGLLLSLLKEKDLYIIHLHTLNRVGAVARVVSKIRKIPYVITIHGGVLDMPKEHLEELSQPYRGSFNWGKPIDILIGKNRVFDDSSAIICVGEEEAKLMQDKYPNKLVEFIPNGVNLDKFNGGDSSRFRDKFNVNLESQVILSVGSFHPLKNQNMLIEAFLELNRYYKNLHLVLIGVLYNQEYFDKLQDMAKDSKNITIIKNLSFDSPTLKDAYNTANIFVHPTKYDAFGIVVLEAWTQKIPTIVSSIGDLNHL
jgi:glycosyltransferase involved in cell wall biosynthesis